MEVQGSERATRKSHRCFMSMCGADHKYMFISFITYVWDSDVVSCCSERYSLWVSYTIPLLSVDLPPCTQDSIAVYFTTEYCAHFAYPPHFLNPCVYSKTVRPDTNFPIQSNDGKDHDSANQRSLELLQYHLYFVLTSLHFLRSSLIVIPRWPQSRNDNNKLTLADRHEYILLVRPRSAQEMRIPIVPCCRGVTSSTIVVGGRLERCPARTARLEY
jgi:hypothetical protein